MAGAYENRHSVTSAPTLQPVVQTIRALALFHPNQTKRDAPSKTSSTRRCHFVRSARFRAITRFPLAVLVDKQARFTFAMEMKLGGNASSSTPPRNSRFGKQVINAANWRHDRITHAFRFSALYLLASICTPFETPKEPHGAAGCQ